MSAGKMKRRGFLKGAAGAAAGMVAAPYVITSSALGAGGRAPAFVMFFVLVAEGEA